MKFCVCINITIYSISDTYSGRNSRVGNGSGLMVMGGGFFPFGFPELMIFSIWYQP